MQSSSAIRFDDRVVIVTGASAGLGRAYALELGRLGAHVVVNGRSAATETVATQIRAAGGSAVACKTDVRDGRRIAECALDHYGRIDALLSNAGIVRDRTFAKMSGEEWDEVLDIHLGGTYACVSAVWPHLIGRQFGRIVLTSSGAGLHGNFGQSNYATAKAGLIALGKTLALEGKRDGVSVNVLAPMALTDMNDSVFDARMKRELRIERVVPFALALCHEHMRDTGLVIEVGGGWGAAVRWERAPGVAFDDASLSTAAVLARWRELQNFAAGADHPNSTADSLAAAVEGLRRKHASRIERVD